MDRSKCIAGTTYFVDSFHYDMRVSVFDWYGQNIRDFYIVLRRYIDSKWMRSQDELLRTGRRARRSDGKCDLKHKPRKSQRKATMVFPPIHPDCQRAYDEILKVGQKCRDVVLDMAEKAEQAADEEIMKKKEAGENDGSEPSDSDSE